MSPESPQLAAYLGMSASAPYRLPGDTDEDMARMQAELDADEPVFQQRKQKELAALKNAVQSMYAKALSEQTGGSQMK